MKAISSLFGGAAAASSSSSTAAVAASSLFRIQLASDLHTEFFQPDFGDGSSKTAAAIRAAILRRLVQPSAPFLALVGDIGAPFSEESNLLEVLKVASSSFKHVFLVLGNHEYYQEGRSIKFHDEHDYLCPSLHHFGQVRERVLSLLQSFPNVSLMDRHAGPMFVCLPSLEVSSEKPSTSSCSSSSSSSSSVVRVIGCTLWSQVPSYAKKTTTSYLMDYRLILPPPKKERDNDGEGAYRPLSSASSSSSSSGAAAATGGAKGFKSPLPTVALPLTSSAASNSSAMVVDKGAGEDDEENTVASASGAGAGIGRRLFGGGDDDDDEGKEAGPVSSPLPPAPVPPAAEDAEAKGRYLAAKKAADKANLNPALFHEGRERRKDALFRFLSAEHEADLAFLVREISGSTQATAEGEEAGCVILSHHAPTFDGTSHPRYRTPLHNQANCGFASSLEYLFRSYRNEDNSSVLAWLFGHSHYNVDKTVEGTRVVSNQRGYNKRGAAVTALMGSAKPFDEKDPSTVALLEQEVVMQGEDTGLPYDPKKVIEIPLLMPPPA